MVTGAGSMKGRQQLETDLRLSQEAALQVCYSEVSDSSKGCLCWRVCEQALTITEKRGELMRPCRVPRAPCFAIPGCAGKQVERGGAAASDLDLEQATASPRSTQGVHVLGDDATRRVSRQDAAERSRCCASFKHCVHRARCLLRAPWLGVSP